MEKSFFYSFSVRATDDGGVYNAVTDVNGDATLTLPTRSVLTGTLTIRDESVDGFCHAECED